MGEGGEREESIHQLDWQFCLVSKHWMWECEGEREKSVRVRRGEREECRSANGREGRV